VFPKIFKARQSSSIFMIELIITEKPKSAQRIAESLADGKPLKKGAKGVYYYEITHGNNDIIVASSVGHLFGVAEKKKQGLKYPVFDVEWKPLFEITKSAAFSQKYYDQLEKLAKKADSFTVACDYDIEGSVIGMNIIKLICKQKDARRMKFSTLTKPDLVKAYENVSDSLDWGQAIAGETRHNLDFFYGINLSRALTASIKKAGMFKILSIGRVQGPTLKIIVEKEQEISAFKPEPFWQLELTGTVKKDTLVLLHKNDKFWDKKEVQRIFQKVDGKDGVVSDVKKQDFEQKAPSPFDLTTLQTEAYRCFGLNPKLTLSVAQDLYTSGLISYPRTSSQQLPATIGYSKIIKQLQKNVNYESLCAELLKTKLTPNNGKKSDPAHPAIYPTGVKSRSVTELNQKIYDIIVRRFLATFGEAAVRETVTISVEVEKEVFVTSGTRTKYEGWHKYYGIYAKVKEEELPAISVKNSIKQKKLEMQTKETKPPARYTPASIIKELEKRNLGTKSTRADVVDTLYRRNYVSDKALKATDLGIKIVQTLQKYIPKVVDEELTRHFEMEMEEVRENKKEMGVVLEEARDVLIGILEKFKTKEAAVGKELFEATKSSEIKENTVGKCMVCDKGTLMIKFGKFGRFIACSRYPDCKTTFKLPSNVLIKTTTDVCDKCQHPKVTIIKKRKRPQEVCINPDCQDKRIETDKENTTCEKCKEGKLVLRKSVYGQFLACNRFPKCRNIIK